MYRNMIEQKVSAATTTHRSTEFGPQAKDVEYGSIYIRKPSTVTYECFGSN
jgi:hypothetical protein